MSEERRGIGGVWVSDRCIEVEVFQRRGGGEDGMDSIGRNSLGFVEVLMRDLRER